MSGWFFASGVLTSFNYWTNLATAYYMRVNVDYSLLLTLLCLQMVPEARGASNRSACDGIIATHKSAYSISVDTIVSVEAYHPKVR